MALLRGAVIFITSILVVIGEIYYLILQPLVLGVNVQMREVQYWAIVIPVFVITFMLSSTFAWVGYTMMTTPEPVRFDYEEAYEVAKVEEQMDETKI